MQLHFLKRTTTVLFWALIFFVLIFCVKKSEAKSVCTNAEVCQKNEAQEERILYSNKYSGPSWDISEEYNAINDSSIDIDIKKAENEIRKIEKISKEELEVYLVNASSLTKNQIEKNRIYSILQVLHDLSISSAIYLLNVRSYATCTLSTNTSNFAAHKLFERLNYLALRHSQSYSVTSEFLNLISEDVLKSMMEKNGSLRDSEFLIRQSRKMKANSLSLVEENLLDSYAVPGILAWGTLYTELSGALTVDLGPSNGGNVGLATAEGKLNSPNEGIREKAWRGINAAWRPHLLTCASALNAMTAWRQETARRRNYKNFLTPSLHAHRMKGTSLEAMMGAVRNFGAGLGRKALIIQASALHKSVMQPWDLSAPAPMDLLAQKGSIYSFDQATDLIANAADSIDEDMGNFVRMMRDNRYIEASSHRNKRPGSFSTTFFKSRKPRVYLNDFNGMYSDIVTLAHELGHAWHSWVMRDMPPQTVDLPPNLSETASLFLETVTMKELIRKSKTLEERFLVQWTRAQNAHKFLCNVPARFDFEYGLNQKRSKSRLSVKELENLMVISWKNYYNDSLGSINETGSFFASKLHFYIPGISFYNHSYIFGYLFSLGILSMRETMGDISFSTQYKNLLRESGSLSAEDLVMKHLGENIENEIFWVKAIEMVEVEVNEFENAAKLIGL